MPKIQNWSLATTRNVSEIRGLSGTVRAWEHDETGERVEIRRIEDDEAVASVWYNISYHAADDPVGETVTAHSTLADARASVVETLRHRTDGLGVEP